MAHILITNYLYGGPTDGGNVATEEVGINVDNAIFTEVNSNDPKAADGVNSKITYRNDPTTVFYTDETVAQLCAQSNGTLSGS